MSNPYPPSQRSSPEQKVENRPNYTAAIVTLLSSVVLAAGSCYGFLSTFDINGSGKHAFLNGFFLVVFCLCVVVFPGTIIWMIARAIRKAKSGNES